MSKRALIAKYLQDIRASYWFLPTALALLAVLVAQSTLALDRNNPPLPDSWQTTQVEGARATLALISQSMIGVAGVMFSITIVAVSFASGNFGPRLIGNFMRDRGNQWCLGILIATFVYTLLILRAVQSAFGPNGEGAAFVPHVSMLVALGLTAVAVMSMIYFVHHIPETINVSNISAALGNRLHTSLRSARSTDDDTDRSDDHAIPDRAADVQVRLHASGYIQTWNKSRLEELATEHDMVVQVAHVAGDFISSNTPVLQIWCAADVPDKLLDAFRDCFALGSVPTEPQNPLFIVDQLVEMVARAMSPGVNDPFTAMNCINWLYIGLGTAAASADHTKHCAPGRVKHPIVDFETLLAASFGNIEPYVRDDKIVVAHLTKMLDRLAEEVAPGAARDQIKKLRENVAKPG